MIYNKIGKNTGPNWYAMHTGFPPYDEQKKKIRHRSGNFTDMKKIKRR